MGITLRHPLSERTWVASLVVELIDPVSGLLVHRSVALHAALAAGGSAALPPPVVTASGRFAFLRLPPGEALVVEATPRGAPFFPARLELPADTGTRHVRIALAPRRDYPFASGDRVIHHCLHGLGGPIAGAEVMPADPALGLLAAPSRTDEDGEFVLHLRTDLPTADGPLPPGQSPGLHAAPRRVGLVFKLGTERRRLPEDAGPALPERGRVVPSGPSDVIRWERLAPLQAEEDAGGPDRPGPGAQPFPRPGQRT